MDLTHKFMNIVLPPITLILLLLFLPPFLVFKFLSFIKRTTYIENVAGKIVLITGASRGIGEQLAYEYARKGACLVLTDIREDLLRAVANKARHLGSPDVIEIGADVSKAEDCKRFVDEAVNHFGRLDHLVNNAGIGTLCAFENITQISDFTPTMNVNFLGTVYATHSAVPHLRKSRGKIVVIASILGWYPLPKLGFYNASKAALISFYETLRMEVGCEIGITIVTPGLIKTQLTQYDHEFKVQMNFIPSASAEECAKAIVNSACRGDKYLTLPSWIRVLYWWKVFYPEIVEWCNRWALMTKFRTRKRIEADYVLDEKFLYPVSIQSSKLE